MLYAEKYECKRFVETGTKHRKMVDAVLDALVYITSIKINPDYYRKSKKRFSDIKHLELLYGDSGVLLPKVLNEIKKLTLFWLDAHGYCPPKEIEHNPVFIEVGSILNHHIEGILF